MSDRPVYAPIPARALADTRLSGTDFRLLAAIAAHDRFGKNGTGCFASQRRLAALIGAHDKAVARSAGRLMECGYLTSERSPTNGRLVIYRIIYDDRDAHAMRGDGRSFTKSAGLRLATEPGIGNKTATDEAPGETAGIPNDEAGISNKSAPENRPIGNNTREKNEEKQCAARANIFPERENRLGEALLGGDLDSCGEVHPAAARRIRDEAEAQERVAGASAVTSAEDARFWRAVDDELSQKEQVAVLRRAAAGVRASPALLATALSRGARGLT